MIRNQGLLSHLADFLELNLFDVLLFLEIVDSDLLGQVSSYEVSLRALLFKLYLFTKAHLSVFELLKFVGRLLLALAIVQHRGRPRILHLGHAPGPRIFDRSRPLISSGNQDCL